MLGAYNATPQATTAFSPAELLHGRPMRTKLNVTGSKIVTPISGLETIRERVAERQSYQKSYADSRRVAKEQNFEKNTDPVSTQRTQEVQ